MLHHSGHEDGWRETVQAILTQQLWIGLSQHKQVKSQSYNSKIPCGHVTS